MVLKKQEQGQDLSTKVCLCKNVVVNTQLMIIVIDAKCMKKSNSLNPSKVNQLIIVSSLNITI